MPGLIQNALGILAFESFYLLSFALDIFVDQQLYSRLKKHLLKFNNKNDNQIQCQSLLFYIVQQSEVVNYYFYYQNLMKHKLSLDYNDPNPYMNHCKQSGITQKRLSPQYSSVLQNQINNLQTNELSWLQKFAEDNQKICSSGLFDQNLQNTKKPSVTNQMKFSFNMNYSLQDKKTQDQTIPFRKNYQYSHLSSNEPKSRLKFDESKSALSDIKNSSNILHAQNRKDSLPGSIKKNHKNNKCHYQEVSEYQRDIAENTPMSKLQEMNERLNKALQKDRSSSLINNKENIVRESLPKDKFRGELNLNLNTDKFEDSLKYYQRTKQVSVQPKKQTNTKPTYNIKQQQSLQKKQQQSLQRSLPFSKLLSLEFLFDKLDVNKSGKLSKTNCKTQQIPQEFKFIFGSILTKIKFKEFNCAKTQFTKLAQSTLQQLNSSEAIDLLNHLRPSQNQSLSNNITTKKNQEQRSETTKRFNDKNPFQTFEARQFKKSISLLESSFKGESKIQSRVNPSITNGDKTSKQTSQSIRRYNQRPPLKKSAIFDEDSYSSKFDFQPSIKYQMNDTYNKKYSNIGEINLEQHKRSIDNLTRLSKRMQTCLNTNILSQHNKQGLLREDSLTFQELIKHV